MDLRLLVAATAMSVCGCGNQTGPDPDFCTAMIMGTNPVADGKSTVTIVAQLRDAGLVPLKGQSITVGVSGTGNLLGQPTLTDSTGHATVTLASTVAEPKTISVSVINYESGLLTEVSNKPMITFVPGAPSRLAFSSEPAVVAAGIPIPSVKVAIFDAFDNSVGAGDPGTPVTIILSGGTAGATLGGTITQTSVVGEATFGDLTVSAAGMGYRLVAISTGLGVGAVSSAFNVQ
jgi:hypothetical protein